MKRNEEYECADALTFSRGARDESMFKICE